MSTTPSNPVQSIQPITENAPLVERLHGWPATAPRKDAFSSAYVSALLIEAKDRIEELEKALRPFAVDKMPSARRSEIAFDRHGLRRCISPLELARDKARAVLQPKGAV